MVVHGAAYLISRKSSIGHSTRLIDKQQWLTKYYIEDKIFTKSLKQKKDGWKPCNKKNQQLKCEQSIKKINKR